MFWKRFFIVAGVLVILAFLAQLMVAPRMKDLLTGAAKDHLGLDISIGDCNMSVLKRKIVLTDVKVLNPEREGDYFFKAKELSADFYLIPILFNKQVLKTVSLTDPEVILTLGEDGKFKLPEIKKTDKGPSKRAGDLLFKKFSVTGGSLQFIDQKISSPAIITRFSGIDGQVVNSVSLSDRSIITSINVKGNIEGQGSFSVDGKGKFLEKPISFDGKVKIENVPLPKFSPYYGNNLSVKVRKGNLFVDTGAVCDKGALNVRTGVKIQDVDLEPVGDPNKTVLFEIKTSDVIEFLRDEDNAVSFSFEIKGDLSKPDFKWGDEMARALRNSMLKAFTDGVVRLLRSPVKAGEKIGEILGGEAGETAKKIGEKLQGILGK